jgi:hypothetical protein
VAVFSKLLDLSLAICGIPVGRGQDTKKHSTLGDGIRNGQVEVLSASKIRVPPELEVAALAGELLGQRADEIADPPPRLVILVGITDEKVVLKPWYDRHVLNPPLNVFRESREPVTPEKKLLRFGPFQVFDSER